MLKNTLKNHKKHLFLSAIVFLVSILFFTKISPIFPYDTDDFIHSSSTRKAYPLHGIWNPSRVLPETLMPAVGFLAGLIFYPITKNYIASMTLTNALTISIFIVIYISCFYKLLSKFSNNSFSRFWVSLIFLALHFIVFAKNPEGNSHAFTVADQTVLYFYTIPSLLGSSMVFYILSKGELNPLKNASITERSILILSSYFAILSNVFCSALISFSTVNTIIQVIKSRKAFNIKKLAHNLSYHLSIITLWVISVLFEFTGGRADSLSGGLRANFKTAVKNLITPFSNINNLIAIVAVLLIAFWIFFSIKKKTQKDNHQAIVLISTAIFSTLLIFILSVRANPNYLSRPHVLFPIISILLAVVSVIFLKFIRIFQGEVLLPLMLLILIFEAPITNTTAYRPNSTALHSSSGPENYHNIASQKDLTALNLDIFDQIKSASDNGLSELEIKVPKTNDTNSNWPFTKNHGQNIGISMLRHGIIDKPIKITTSPDIKINKKFGIYK